jgi:hypothetical protein
MTCFVRSPRDLAREDLYKFHKLHATGRDDEAAEIVQRYGLAGLAPREVSLALEAASHDRDPLEAIAQPMEGLSDE